MQVDDEVRRLAQTGEKAAAIQRLRQTSALSFSEAHDAVERLRRKEELPVTDPKAERIIAQVSKVATTSLVGRKEIRELPSILWDDEDVLDIAQGMYNNGNGVLVATQRRLVFVDKGFLYGLKVEDFPLDKISSIQYQTGLLLATITIFTSGNKAEIKNVDKGKARSFAEGVRARIGRKEEMPATPASAVTTPSDPIADLERLAALKEKGFVTEEEFQAKKKQLLGL